MTELYQTLGKETATKPFELHSPFCSVVSSVRSPQPTHSPPRHRAPQSNGVQLPAGLCPSSSHMYSTSAGGADIWELQLLLPALEIRMSSCGFIILFLCSCS